MPASTQFESSIDLSTLNGFNGFSIQGTFLSQSGISVSSAGDFNGDGINDIMIGAPGTTIVASYMIGNPIVINTTPSNCYVVFGKREIGSAGTLSLASLSSNNGLTMTGFPIYSLAGTSVSGIGDINNDGIADLLIGAPYYCEFDIIPASTGECYVIFGSKEIGGTLSISHLNGNNGFNITGFPGASRAGAIVSGAGDINGDGIADLVIGAPGTPYFFIGKTGGAGACYIVFGQQNIGVTGIFNVSQITGANGFAIIGFPAHSNGCGSVDGVGDVNGDGIDDLIIGNLYPSTNIGAYVVLGSGTIGNSGVFNISKLTGNDGFAISGFSIGSSPSVSGVGDINGDGLKDLFIGAYDNENGYVLFGNNAIGSSGLLSVSALNGVNGFSITGLPSKAIGASAGDINSDGIADLLIGIGDSTSTTTGYLIFGSLGLGSSGTFAITDLNGENGFATTGFPEYASTYVSGAGDINADGVADLMVSDASASGTGISYVMFGNLPTVLSPNNLLIQKGHTQLISAAFINTTSPLHPDNPHLIFTVSDLLHGDFQLVNMGTSVTTFTQQQIDNGQIQFVHDDSVFAPSYSISLNDGAFMFSVAQPANITFIHLGPRLITNSLEINQGETVAFSNAQLLAINQDNSADTDSLIFSISAVFHGNFTFSYAPQVAIYQFTQLQIEIGSVQFTADGSNNSPSYLVTVSDGGITTLAQPGMVSFDLPPSLLNNSLSINQGQIKILTSLDLSATDPDHPAEILEFIASNAQHGHFELISNPGGVINSFIQQQVQNGEVQFVPDGSSLAPSYRIAVSDGRMTLPPQASVITFNITPLLVNNTLTVKQGTTIVLTTINFSALDPDDNAAALKFLISELQHGKFEWVSKPDIALMNFTLAQVLVGAVQFVHDGSYQAPSYWVAVDDGKITTVPQSGLVIFDAAPVLVSNYLTIAQGQTVVLTPGYLSASDSTVPTGNLLFTADAITHGYFEDSDFPGQAITQFLQQRIANGAIHFVADGSPISPAYNISVSDGSLSTAPTAAIINFISTSTSATTSSLIRNAIIGASVSGGIGLLFLALKLYLSRKATQSMRKALKNNSSDIERKHAKFHQEIIQPLAKNIFDRIKTTYFLGYRSDDDTKAFLVATEHLVSCLFDAGVELNFTQLSAQQQNRLLNEIVRQTRLQVVLDYHYCSINFLCSFFKPEVTPKQLEQKAASIAQAVAAVLRSRDFSRTSPTSKSLEQWFEDRAQAIETRLDNQKKRADKIEMAIRPLLTEKNLASEESEIRLLM